MKLTIEELSKRTKLSIPTLRVYVSRQKLGTKVGNNRYFSQADVDKLTKGSSRGGGRRPAKTAKAAKSSRPAKTARKKTAVLRFEIADSGAGLASAASGQGGCRTPGSGWR